MSTTLAAWSCGTTPLLPPDEANSGRPNSGMSSRSLVRTERTGPTKDASFDWNTAASRVRLASTGSSMTMSACLSPDWGRASETLSILTIRAGRLILPPKSPWTPVSGATGGGGVVVVVVGSGEAPPPRVATTTTTGSTTSSATPPAASCQRRRRRLSSDLKRSSRVMVGEGCQADAGGRRWCHVAGRTPRMPRVSGPAGDVCPPARAAHWPRGHSLPRTRLDHPQLAQPRRRLPDSPRRERARLTCSGSTWSLQRRVAYDPGEPARARRQALSRRAPGRGAVGAEPPGRRHGTAAGGQEGRGLPGTRANRRREGPRAPRLPQALEGRGRRVLRGCGARFQRRGAAVDRSAPPRLRGARPGLTAQEPVSTWSPSLK